MEEFLEMRPDRARRESQSIRDLLVGQAGRDEWKDLGLARLEEVFLSLTGEAA